MPHASCSRALSVRAVMGCEIRALLTKPTKEVWWQSYALGVYFSWEVARRCRRTGGFKPSRVLSSRSCACRRSSRRGPDLPGKMPPFLSFLASCCWAHIAQPIVWEKESLSQAPKKEFRGLFSHVFVPHSPNSSEFTPCHWEEPSQQVPSHQTHGDKLLKKFLQLPEKQTWNICLSLLKIQASISHRWKAEGSLELWSYFVLSQL